MPNIIAVNSDGFPTDLKGKLQSDDTSYQQYLDAILQSISQAKRVVIFIHGGLTEPKEAIEHSKKLTAELEKSGITPVFIVWHSGLVSTYFESLFFIRRGNAFKRGFHRLLVLLMFPFLLVEDIARGLTRFVQTVLITAGRDAQTDDEFFAEHPDWFPLKNGFRLALGDFFPESKTDWISFVQETASKKKGNLTIVSGADLGYKHRKIRFLRYWLGFLPHMAWYSLIDAVGKRAWDNMLRRTRTINGNNPDVHQPDYKPPVQRFFHGLANLNLVNVEVDIVGHSMGPIVVNEIIRQNPTLKFDNIIFMAAACSIRHFIETTDMYLNNNVKTNFYNLCLHPRSEVSEPNALGLTRGSLLVWIDNFFADIISLDDRTLGSFENCIRFNQLLNTRANITLKSFSADNCLEPQKHGEFSKYPFWEPKFWC